MDFHDDRLPTAAQRTSAKILIHFDTGSYDILHFLLNAGIGVAFVTKGKIPKRHRKLLIDHAELVSGQIGIITLDSDITAAFEPYAAPPGVRLAQMEEFIKHKIAIDARLDPILPGLTDGKDSLKGCSGRWITAEELMPGDVRLLTAATALSSIRLIV